MDTSDGFWIKIRFSEEDGQYVAIWPDALNDADFIDEAVEHLKLVLDLFNAGRSG